ncbi:MAG: peptidase M16 protein [uncultured bacterium]|uniref:Peptidase M16 n=1 Tax=Candidatus Woesebacteria bacterium RIFCSPHIGHO2_12_FULL_41_24 TaxID=1802510 RepID=A0A1F8AT27_9BACT|nr:MAG: peptidase M16 protein [uncultured bacterium]OGM15018.1 MAG: hypothetical protein A2W15_04265 [Candidatus Woesebacteria bacterium RBG_16_41_13]OGM30017.1 MAG: hypothetical protein A2873_04815 [Candidatus Woesebacteria bacterium RIFCSPHIGHO2_01_FULL_42_80]OGM35095.1 MAG: hypothetical protein A3D84_01980 [Candidatus Woesebacteria bacterium RIFCSPHIGHO2_02_FULL_42_20]OGM54831.1 MAG: hypothetical protein A3E44_01580 [Candidatus Woesebacteria bacterium RIFCSPHIGHO2_12_FULL_41_24]OGM67447.1 M
MRYEVSKLANGLRMLCVPTSSVESATLTIWVKTGSRNETRKLSGISHFLEHMAFKGSARRPSAKLVAETVDGIGGEFNASTSKEWMNFYIKCRAGKLEVAFDVIADMLLSPLLLAEEIEREKGVICEEIAMYEDTPMLKIGDLFEEVMFEDHALGWDIAGTKETVRGLKRSDLVRYISNRYFTQNMLLTVSGGIEPDSINKLARQFFLDLPPSGVALSPKPYLSKQTKPRVLLKTKKSDQAHFIFGFPVGGRGAPDRFVSAVLSAVLGKGMSSRLFTEIRERRGLAYSVTTILERYRETGYAAAYAGVDLTKIDEAIKVTADQFYGLASGKYKIESAELTKAKEYLKGHLALSLEDTKDVNYFFGEDALFNLPIETPESMFIKIDKVTADEVVSLAKKIFVPNLANVAVIGPFKSEDRFAKLLV